MMHVKKGSATPDVLLGEKCMELIKDVCRNPGDHKARNIYYAHETVKKELGKIYGNKCAYCERLADPFVADHFRPKKRVKEYEKHPGYYWLTYEWSNLVLSCGKCNRTKWDKFPIKDENINFPLSEENSRVQSPPALNEKGLPLPKWTDPMEKSLLGGEKRLLLNPEWDEDVQKHFSFAPDGKIFAKTIEGKTSIEIYGLDRNILNISRRQTSDSFLVDIKKSLKDFWNREDITQYQKGAYDERLYKDIKKVFLKLLWHVEKNMRHSAYVFYMANNLDKFFIRRKEFLANEDDQSLVKKISQRIRVEYQL